MKKLNDYLPSRPRRKTPAKLSEGPILSPDTAKALENAEILVKEAQKKIIEASYDIDSSPEREKSTGSAREREAEDEDALYIRDIVSTRFHEANESARIFTRPSARPLAERLCKPEVRRGRARRLGEGANNTRTEQSTIRRSKPLRSTSGTSKKNFNTTRVHSFRPQRAAEDKETPSQIPKPSMTSVYRSAGKVADQTSVNSLKVQEGPRVDIRNELTVTDVENVDISPQPRPSFPVRNIKTYEFRHESCVKDIVADAPRTSNEARSTERETGVSSPTRRSPEVAEESADPLRSGAGAGPAPSRQGSRSDLVGNKSGRSIRPKPPEGRADDARISKRGATEHKENPPESFIDFLRRAASDEAPNLCEDAERAKALRNKVLRSLNTKEKIDIFDRAIDEFFDEFKRGDPSKKKSSSSPPRRGEEDRLAESDVVDGDRADDENFDDLAKEAIEDEPEVFGNDWNPEDIKLEPPNFGDLEKTVRRFDSTFEKILLGARNLEVLMSRYCIEAEVPGPEVELTEREPSSRNPGPFFLAPAKEIPNREQKKTAHFRRNKAPKYEDHKSPISEESREIRTAKSSCKASREAQLGWREKKIVDELAESRPRFSTPLNDGSRIIASSRRAKGAKEDFETDDFGRFFIGIERPKCSLEKRRIAVSDEPEVSLAARRNGEENSTRRKKIVLDRIDRNCNFDKLFDHDRTSGPENEENSHGTVTFPTYAAREKRFSSDARNSRSRSLIQDSAIGRTMDQSEKIFLGTKLIDERVTRKDSSRSERSAPVWKNYEISAMSTLSIKTMTVKNRSVDVEAMAEIGEVEDKRQLTDDRTKKQRSKDEETSEKNRLAGSAGSSPRDRTSLDVSTVYSDDFEEPVVSIEKSVSEENIKSTMNDGENSVFGEKKSSAIMAGREGDVEDNKSVLKTSGEKLELTKSDRQNSIFIRKKSSVMMEDRNRVMEDDKSVLKEIGEKLESTKGDRQNSVFIGKKSSAMMEDRNREVEEGKSVLKEIGEKVESTKSGGQNSIFIEKKSSAMMEDRNREVEDGKSVPNEIGEKLESTMTDGQNSIFKEKESSAMMEVEEGKTMRSTRESPKWPRPNGESRQETKYLEKSFSVSVNESSDRNKDDDERRLSRKEGSVENNLEKKEAHPDSGEVSEKSSEYRASVLSSSGSIKASGTSSLLRKSHREDIKEPEESNGVEAPEDSLLGKTPIACSRLHCERVIYRRNCEECTNCPVLETIEVLEESSSIDAFENVADDSIRHNEEEEEMKRAITEPELEAPKSNRPDEAFTEFHEICPLRTEEASANRFEKNLPSNFELLRWENEVQKGNIQDGQKEEDKKEPENLEQPKSSRTNKIFHLENEVNKSDRIICEDRERSSFEICTNFEKIGVLESSTIIHSTPEQFVANSGPTIGSLFLPFSDHDCGNSQDLQNKEDQKEPEKLQLRKSSRIDTIVVLENEANKSNRIFCGTIKRSNFESCKNFEKIGTMETSAIIHSTPKQFIANSERTMESLILPLPDPIPDDDHFERAADACSENYSEGELYLPSSCSYSLGEIRISERPSYGTVGTGIESSTRNSDGIRIFFTKSYATLVLSDHTIDAPNTAVQSPGEVQETDVESISSSRGLSSSGEH